MPHHTSMLAAVSPCHTTSMDTTTAMPNKLRLSRVSWQLQGTLDTTSRQGYGVHFLALPVLLLSAGRTFWKLSVGSRRCMARSETVHHCRPGPSPLNCQHSNVLCGAVEHHHPGSKFKHCSVLLWSQFSCCMPSSECIFLLPCGCSSAHPLFFLCAPASRPIQATCWAACRPSATKQLQQPAIMR